MEKAAIDAHKLSMRQVMNRIDKDSINRIDKLDGILNGLTASER